jgi:hypothetical protein
MKLGRLWFGGEQKMIGPYSHLLCDVERSLASLGFTLQTNVDYRASFSNRTGWDIVFEGERYAAPAFDLLVVRNKSNEPKVEFSVRILMQVFAKSSGEALLKPSLENQLEFLVKNGSWVFAEPIPYEAEYRRLNLV